MAKVADSSVAAIAMAIVGRRARACDVCATKGAHWFCAADDAYLCTACDMQVHSANALSLRHERVRLSSNGTPVAAKGDSCKVPGAAGCKKAHPGPAQVAPVRKRSRTTRPYAHHLMKLTQVVKAEEPGVVKAELELFDFLDADEFLVADAGNQEVPNLVDSSSSGEFDLLSSDYEHSASADSFAAFFKGKAAQQSQSAVDEFLVPDKGFESSTSPEDAFFFPGDIPGLDTFVPEMDLSSDDFSLSFDLALQNHSNGGVETFEGELAKPDALQPQDVVASPFAKWFATKRESDEVDEEPLSPERIKRDAMAMLKCCEGDASVPSLQLNFQEVLTAWSGRGEPWIVAAAQPDSSPTTSSDGAGLVPDLASCGGDESQSSGDRDARVLRYKEKRRTRLFSKKIRYEVRKLNAERRPRMKGRFVKRSSLACTAAAS